MTIAPILASILETISPPGKTAFSVEVAADCAPHAMTCEDAKRSSFYGAWVRQESPEKAKVRYALVAEVIEQEARRALCVGPAGEVTCARTKAQTRFTVKGLMAIAAGVGTYESGWREDVMVGRGKSGKPSDDGGQGRGPGGERCALQIHPSVMNDDSLLGTDRAALSRCVAQGMAMLIQARNHCAWAAPKVDPTWSTVSMYGTGNSCDSINAGKTRPRVNLALKIYAQLRAAK